MGKGRILKIVIFALLWIVGEWFFSSFGGAAGTTTSFLYIGQTIVGSNFNTEGDKIISIIITFIITAVAYFLVSMILNYIIMKIFRRN